MPHTNALNGFTSILNYSLLFCFLFSVPIGKVRAQELLSPKDAAALVSKQNREVMIATNAVDVAENSSSIQANGYLPTLGVNAGANYNLDNGETEFQDGRVTSLQGAASNSFNAAVNLDYTVFDGFNRKNSINRARDNYLNISLQARATLERSLLEMFRNYYEVARLSENAVNLKSSLNISKERLQRAQYQTEYGRAIQLNVLNAQVDLNTDSIDYITAVQQLENSKRSLNVLLGRDTRTNFRVDTTVVFDTVLYKKELEDNLIKNNVRILQAQKEVSIGRYDTKIQQSGRIPRLDLSSSYIWNKNNNNAASFVAGSQSNGLRAGLNLAWPIFDGGRTRTEVQNAKINEQSRVLEKELTFQEVQRDFDNAWGDYRNKLFVLKAQEQNLSTNRINFNRTKEQYQLGRVTSIEFRQAQINLLNAQNNKNQAKYESKIAEMQLLQLSGEFLDKGF